MTTPYKSFRDRTSLESDNSAVTGVDFIDKSLSSTIIHHIGQDKDMRAVLTNVFREGGDEWILFTKTLQDGAAINNIQKGDFITNKSRTYMAYEEYAHPQVELYKKHKMIECNVTLKVNDLEQPAYFVSSLRAFSDLNISDYGGGIAFANNSPMIITKDSDITNVGQKLIILGTGYEIRNIDRISNQGIAYMSVVESVMRDDIDDIVNNISKDTPEPQEIVLDEFTIMSGDTITILTNFAYAVFDSNVEVSRKTSTEIDFTVPFGIDLLTISTKDGAGDVVNTEYRVVI